VHKVHNVPGHFLNSHLSQRAPLKRETILAFHIAAAAATTAAAAAVAFLKNIYTKVKDVGVHKAHNVTVHVLNSHLSQRVPL
jgi:hypothetical protein